MYQEVVINFPIGDAFYAFAFVRQSRGVLASSVMGLVEYATWGQDLIQT